MANHCIMIDGQTGGYAVKLTINNCECRNALLDGILITPPAWSIKITNSLSNSHGRDGIRAIITGGAQINQINDIKLESCTINDNIGEGVNILGVAITIDKCDIENNNIGVKIDASTVTYNSLHINITNNYIEGNKTNQIYAATNTGDGVILNINSNYINSANLGVAIIKCIGIAEGISLNLSRNRFESSNTNIILDGGNCLSNSSLITDDIYLNESKIINLGYARIQKDMFDIIMLPASISTAPSTSTHTTDDLVLRNPKKVEYPVIIDLQWKMLKLFSAKIITNATDYNITANIKVITSIGEVIRNVAFNITGSTNQDWATYISNEWGFYRIPPNHFVTVSFVVNSHTPDRYITINNVCLSYI